MAALKNARRELFAQYLAEGSTQIQAYERAGYLRFLSDGLNPSNWRSECRWPGCRCDGAGMTTPQRPILI